MALSRHRLPVLLAWLGIVALGILAAWWSGEKRHEAQFADLIDRAEHCAVAFVTEDTAQLSGTASEVSSTSYRTVKERLMRLRAVNPSIRFVYLFRTTDQPGRVVFLADSEPADSSEMSKPGDDYPEALQSPGLQEILRTHRPAIEGPLRDSFGEWVTAYAPVGDKPPPGAPRTILGLDVDSQTWGRDVWFVRASVFAVVILLVGVPYGALRARQRANRFTREIHRLSTAIQQSQSAVLITDTERVIEYVNDGCVAMTGYMREELLGQPAAMLLPPELTHPQRQEILSRLFVGDRWQGEIKVRRRNGEIFPAHVALSPVRSAEGLVTSLVAVVEDITESKRAERELREARDQAESADRAKGEFLAMMTHELRTPLNGIIGFATLLQDTSLTAEQIDYAETIRKSGDALLVLTNELLDYSRIDAGRMKLDPQACSVRQVVEEAVELLSARAAEKELEIFVTISPSLPALVLADPGRLRQVFVNLLGNAIKFTPSGEIDVAIEAESLFASPPSDPRVRVLCIVRDTGVGIAAEQQHKLFQPFSQVDASTTRKHGGAGLGLAISRSLVRLMDGDIEVTSTSGAGSEFRFHFLARVLERSADLPQLPQRRVAVVSANSRARRHYAAQLEVWGLAVALYEGVAALPENCECDVILADVRARDAGLWPELLRTHPALSKVPVVGLVSVGVPAAQRDLLRAHFRALLKKPLRDSLFHVVLTSILRR